MQHRSTRPGTSNGPASRPSLPPPAGGRHPAGVLDHRVPPGLMTNVPDRVDRRIRPGETIRRHAAAALIPRPRPAQYRALRESIREHGVREPVLLSEGRLLDGRARLRACRALGIECPAVEIGPVEDPLALVLALNVQRRHLKAGQLAMLAVRLCDRPRGGSPNAYASAMDQGRAAELLGISRSAIGLAGRIARSGREDLIEAVAAGTMSLRRAIAQLGGPAAGPPPGPAGFDDRDHDPVAAAIPPLSAPGRTPASRGEGPQSQPASAGVPAGRPGPSTLAATTAPDPESARKRILARLAERLRIARRLGPDDMAHDRDGFRIAGIDLPVGLLGAAYEVWECGTRAKFQRLREVEPEWRGIVGRTSAIDRPDLERIGELADYLWRAFQCTVTQEIELPMLPRLLWAPEMESLKQVCTDILAVLDAEASPEPGHQDDEIELVEADQDDEEFAEV